MRIITLVKTVLLAMAALTVFAAAPAQADWRRAETAHFIVYGEVSESTIRNYAQRLERFDGLLRAYYPIETQNEIPKLDIFLAEGQRGMERAYPGIGGNVAGFYSSNNGRIYAVVNTQAISGDVVLFHEYGHHFMFQMRSNAYPSWFVEGFAEYYATADVRPDRIQFGRHHPGRMNALSLGPNSWARMEDVLTWHFSPSGRYPGYLYYAQAWGMTHYFMSTPERTRMLGQYLSAVVGGQGSVEAMQAATGRTPSQLQDDVRMYLSGAITMWTPQIEISEPEVTITTLTAAESALAWLNLRLDGEKVVEEPFDDDGRTRRSEAQKAREARERAEYRADLIRDAFEVSARFPGERAALLASAKAYRLTRDPAAALSTLDPLLGAGSTDADALRLAAHALLDQIGEDTEPAAALALRRRASGYLARSMDADPLDFRTYLGLNDIRRTQPTYPNDNDLSTLETAAALAPQSFDTRLRQGEAYMARGLNAEAVLVMGPVANSPHRSAYTRRAREMIATARTAMGQAVETYEAPPPEDEPEDAD